MLFLDTNILVASAQEFHPNHFECLDLVAQLDSSSAMVSPHVLAEFYSITTGLPKALRLTPREAERFIESFEERFAIVSLTPQELVEELYMAGGRGV